MSGSAGDGEDSGRRYPRNLQGILNFCTEHTKSEDAPSDAQSYEQMDPETASAAEPPAETSVSEAATGENTKPNQPMTEIGRARMAQDKALMALGLFRYCIPGDGNCMFRALATQLGLDAERYHPVLREAAAKWMAEHLEDLMAAGLLDSPDEVIEWGHLGAWPGQAALVSLANIFGIDIAVLHGGDHGDIDIQHITPFDSGEASGMQGSVILAYLYNGHYDAVVDEPDLANPQYDAWIARCKEEVNASEALAHQLSKQDEHLPITGQIVAPLSTLPSTARPEQEFAYSPKSPELTGPEPVVSSELGLPPTTSTDHTVPRVFLPGRLTTTAPVTRTATGTTNIMGTHTGPAQIGGKTVVHVSSEEEQTGTGPLAAPAEESAMEPTSPRIRIVPIHFTGKKLCSASDQETAPGSARSSLSKDHSLDTPFGICPRFIRGLQTSMSESHVSSVPVTATGNSTALPEISRQSSTGSSYTPGGPQSPVSVLGSKDTSQSPIRISHERSQTPVKVVHEKSPTPVKIFHETSVPLPKFSTRESPVRNIPIQISHSPVGASSSSTRSVPSTGAPRAAVVRDIPILRTNSTGSAASTGSGRSWSTDAGLSRNVYSQPGRSAYSQPSKISGSFDDDKYTPYKPVSSLSRDPLRSFSLIDNEARDFGSATNRSFDDDKYTSYKPVSSLSRDPLQGFGLSGSELKDSWSTSHGTSSFDKDSVSGTNYINRGDRESSYGSSQRYTEPRETSYRSSPSVDGLRGSSYNPSRSSSASRDGWSRSSQYSSDSTDYTSAGPKVREIPIRVQHSSKPYWEEHQRPRGNSTNWGKDDTFGLNFEELDLSKPFDVPSFLKPLRRKFNLGDDIEDFLQKNTKW